MGKPTIDERPGLYVYEWSEDAIKIEVRRARTHTDGTVKGELFVTTTAPGYDSILLAPTQVNFSASRTVRDLAGTLSETYPDPDWKGIIGQLAYYTIERTRRGEPVVELMTCDEAPPMQYLLHPLIPRNLPTVIYGEKGVGKSTLALICATCLILPWADNPLGFEVPAETTPVLYLDWESDKDIVLSQLKMIQTGMDIPAFGMQYRRCGTPLVDDIEQIRLHIISSGAQAIIVDSIGPAVGGEMNEAAPALAFYNALRQLNVSALLIGQTSKDKQKTSSIYGSTFYNYLARSVWELKNSSESGEDEASVGVFHRWSNYSKKHHPFGYHLTYGSNAIVIQSQEPKNVGEFMEYMGTRVRILEMLKDGALTVEEITGALQIAKDNARKVLQRLKQQNKVTLLAKNKWGLLYNDEDDTKKTAPKSQQASLPYKDD